MDTIPHTNILGVYQETGKGIEEVENTHRILRKRVKECEDKGKVVIPFKKGDAENCLDLIMNTKGLEDRTVECDWTPARAVSTGKGVGPGKVFIRGQASDHKAQKVTLLLDIVEKGNEGNCAIINYNNREGWVLYNTLSNKYTQEIMQTIPKYKNKMNGNKP